MHINFTARSYIGLTIFILIISVFGCSTVAQKQDDKDIYPKTAERILFKKIGEDSLKVIKEIELFGKDKKLVFGSITGIEILGNEAYVGDGDQKKIFVFDKNTFEYKRSMGSDVEGDPAYLPELFGPLIWHGEILAGSRKTPFLFKSFSTNGEFIRNYPDNSSISWGIALNYNNSFITDSTAYLVKSIAEDGCMVTRLKLSTDFQKIGKDILPVSDFHILMDSASMSNIIHKFFIVKSNISKSFYAVPSNKYLINTYNFEGRRINSLDLRSIPEIEFAYTKFKLVSLLNSYLPSIVLDKDDILYICVQKMLNPEVIEKGLAKDLKVYFSYIGIDIKKKKYKVHHIGVAPTPLKIIGDKLWCFDSRLSKIVIFQLPK